MACIQQIYITFACRLLLSVRLTPYTDPRTMVATRSGMITKGITTAGTIVFARSALAEKVKKHLRSWIAPPSPQYLHLCI